MVYPKEWLEQKPLVRTEYETNRELAVNGFIGHFTRSRRQPFHGNLGQTAACLRHYVSDERLNNIKSSGLPIMIVTGTFDNLVQPKYSHHMKKILQDAARLELFEGSGHAIPEEQPDRYNSLLVDHFTTSNKKRTIARL